MVSENHETHKMSLRILKQIILIYNLLEEEFVVTQLFLTPWPVAHQAPPSMGFSQQEYWSGVPFPSPGDLPDPGTEPAFTSPALAGGFFTPEPPYFCCA